MHPGLELFVWPLVTEVIAKEHFLSLGELFATCGTSSAVGIQL